MTPLRLLTFSTLYPNAAQPNHGVFVENRLRHLVASGEVVSTVLAPVPYFPKGRAFAGLAERFGWQDYAGVPAQELRHGLAVHHPRYPVIPRVGMNLAPSLLFRAAARALRRLVEAGLEFDAIDAHYFYPDGVAAVRLGQVFGKPVVITARGSDITQLAHFSTPRRMIQAAIGHAAALVSVSAALGEGLVELGAPRGKVHVLRNGIDTAMFRPMDRTLSRGVLGVSGRVLVSVGGLIARKGHDRTIQALALLPGYTLLIAGQGPERDALQALAQRLGVADRVRLLGPIPHPLLAEVFSAADASVLSSSREGWANVLLESMACGTPVVASNIPGNPEVVQEQAAGLVVDDNTPQGIAAGVSRLFADLADRAATRAYAERFGWGETTQGQIDLFRRVVGRR
jgi:teichuronic acid biosynthesis glycosyltransferase TuaC